MVARSRKGKAVRWWLVFERAGAVKWWLALGRAGALYQGTTVRVGTLEWMASLEDDRSAELQRLLL